MSYKQKINDVTLLLEKKLTGDEYLPCINILKSIYITKIIKNNELTKENIDYLYNIYNIGYIDENRYNLVHFISKFKNIIRNDSNGFVNLTHAIISNNKYKEFSEYHNVYNEPKSLKIYGCNIITSSYLKNDSDIIAIGLCYNNQEIVDYTKKIIIGRLE